MARLARRCSGLAFAAALAGCSSEGARPAPPPPAGGDAGIVFDATAAPPYEAPAPGAPIEEGPGRARTAPVRGKRPVRPIDITLKSDPPGAQVYVDGRLVGTTPTLWPGESDGLDHEFAFWLRGHASARYRFVPITSGVLHAKLQPVATGTPDGGLEPRIAPTLAPDAAVSALDAVPSVTPLPSPAVTPVPPSATPPPVTTPPATAPPATAPPATAPPATTPPATPAPAPGSASEPRQPGLAPPT